MMDKPIKWIAKQVTSGVERNYFSYDAPVEDDLYTSAVLDLEDAKDRITALEAQLAEARRLLGELKNVLK
jgi:hypothetical protein